MELFLTSLIIAFLIIIGNALLLLRTARHPKLPPSVRPQPYWDDDE